MSTVLPNPSAPPSGLRATPRAEVEITPELVSSLLAAQHPDLTHLPIRLLESGWDNTMFRLGDELLIRLPRRKIAAEIIGHEQTWLPELAPRLPLPVPAPMRLGAPGEGYPWSWSVLPWLEGQAADQHPADPNQWAAWVGFLRALHREPHPEAPINGFRGVPLRDRADVIEPRLERLSRITPFITPTIERLWRQAIHTPVDIDDTWLHGDLHQRNVLTRGGRFAGVIDWGDVCRGDRATDLASIWMQLTDSSSRHRACAALTEVTQETWHRAQGWAVFYATLLLDTGSVDNARHASMGELIFQRLEEDFGPSIRSGPWDGCD